MLLFAIPKPMLMAKAPQTLSSTTPSTTMLPFHSIYRSSTISPVTAVLDQFSGTGFILKAFYTLAEHATFIIGWPTMARYPIF